MKPRTYFKDIYEHFTMSVYCDTLKEFQKKFVDKGIDCKKFLEEEFKIKF